MGEYLVHSADGFAGLADTLSGRGREGFEIFMGSPAPLILLGVVAVLWVARKLR